MEITLWDRVKFWTFMKLGSSMWTYTIVHTDYWKKPYGISFTSEKDWGGLLLKRNGGARRLANPGRTSGG